MLPFLFQLALAIAPLPSPSTCHPTPMADGFDGVGCNTTELVITVPYDVSELAIDATDDCDGQDSTIFAYAGNRTVRCTVKDGSNQHCVLEDLPEGTKVFFQCRGAREDGAGCSVKRPTLI